jgi:hypothetical protein
MKLAQTTITILLAAATTALAVATSAAAAEGPVEGAAGGCALQCIEKALVTPTASSAKVEIGTTVPAKVVVTVRRLSNIGGPPDTTATGPLFRTTRTLFLHGLQPETTYRIRVTATDASARVAVRVGTFETREVETAVDPAAGGLSSGLGCSAACITKAVPLQIGPTAALFEIATNTPARITVSASRAGSAFVVSTSTSSLTTRYTPAASPLLPGTRYDLVVRATDADGRTEEHQFTFRTVERKARITFWMIQVIDDGDRGANRGELSFSYWLGRKSIGGDAGFIRHSSGDVFDVHPADTSRQGLSGVIPANGANPTLDIRVDAEECDGHTYIVFCESEVESGLPAGGGKNVNGYDHATAGGPFSLNTLLAHGALPGAYGTMLPSGHNAYVVFETTQYHLKFRVYAYLDYFYAW